MASWSSFWWQLRLWRYEEQLASMKNMSDKSQDKNETSLWDFIISGYGRTKLASIVYGVSKSKGKGLGYPQKPYNSRFNILVKPSDPSSSSTTEKGLNAYFLSAAKKVKTMNQSELMINNSWILKDSKSKVIISKVHKGLEVKVKTCPRQTV